MSIGSINSGSALNRPTLSRQTNPAAAAGTDAGGSGPSAGTSVNSPSDSIDVNLPNGFSVDVTQIGTGGFNSNLLQTLQDMVSKLSAYSSSANSNATGNGPQGATSDTASNTTTAGEPGIVGMNMIHVDLPNGISVELRHSAVGESSSQSLSEMNALVDAADELVQAFAEYPGASAATDDTTGASAATNSTHKLSDNGSGNGASYSQEAAAYAAALSLANTPSITSSQTVRTTA
jgi:hypothetical protein